MAVNIHAFPESNLTGRKRQFQCVGAFRAVSVLVFGLSEQRKSKCSVCLPALLYWYDFVPLFPQDSIAHYSSAITHLHHLRTSLLPWLESGFASGLGLGYDTFTRDLYPYLQKLASLPVNEHIDIDFASASTIAAVVKNSTGYNGPATPSPSFLLNSLLSRNNTYATNRPTSETEPVIHCMKSVLAVCSQPVDVALPLLQALIPVFLWVFGSLLSRFILPLFYVIFTKAMRASKCLTRKENANTSKPVDKRANTVQSGAVRGKMSVYEVVIRTVVMAAMFALCQPMVPVFFYFWWGMTLPCLAFASLFGDIVIQPALHLGMQYAKLAASNIADEVSTFSINLFDANNGELLSQAFQMFDVSGLYMLAVDWAGGIAWWQDLVAFVMPTLRCLQFVSLVWATITSGWIACVLLLNKCTKPKDKQTLSTATVSVKPPTPVKEESDPKPAVVTPCKLEDDLAAMSLLPSTAPLANVVAHTTEMLRRAATNLRKLPYQTDMTPLRYQYEFVIRMGKLSIVEVAVEAPFLSFWNSLTKAHQNEWTQVLQTHATQITALSPSDISWPTGPCTYEAMAKILSLLVRVNKSALSLESPKLATAAAQAACILLSMSVQFRMAYEEVRQHDICDKLTDLCASGKLFSAEAEHVLKALQLPLHARFVPAAAAIVDASTVASSPGEGLDDEECEDDDAGDDDGQEEEECEEDEEDEE